MWKVSGSEVLMQLLSGELCFDIHELPPLLSSFVSFSLTSYLLFLQYLSSFALPHLLLPSLNHLLVVAG